MWFVTFSEATIAY